MSRATATKTVDSTVTTPAPDTQAEKTGPAPLPLTPEEIADRLVPDDPQISPDGRTVAFTVAPSGRKGEHGERAIWLSIDGKAAEPFTSGIAEDASPRWSPDGLKLLFTSDRKERGKHRLYLIGLSGGEARPVGDLEGEFTSPQWSPDGKFVAVLRKDPETDEEKKRKEDRNDAIEVDLHPKLNRLWVVNVETGSARCLTHGTRQVWSYAWSLDGARIAIVTTEAADVNATLEAADLWTVPSSGGLATHVARYPSMPDNPIYVETSDGLMIVTRGNAHRDDPADSAWVVPAGGGQPRNVLPAYEGNVDWIGPLEAKAGLIALRIVEHTHAHAYCLDITNGKLTPITPKGMQDTGSILDGPSVAEDRSKLALIWSAGNVPEEVYVAAPGKKPARVTTFGKTFAGRLSPVEQVTWQSDDVEIEGLLTLPAGYEPGKRYPLIVEIHGGPSWQWEDRVFLDWHDWAQLMASHGYAVLAPNPRGSTGRGSTFQKLLQDDVGGGESRDLVNGAKAMVERGIADPDRLGIGGWSWGGYLTAMTITQTDIFKAAMMGAGLSNVVSDHGQDDIPSANLLYFPGLPYQFMEHYWQSSPIRHVASVTTPTLILHGDADARVHPAQGMEFYRALKSLGVPVEFVRYPREGHPIKERHHQIDLMRRLVVWYDRWLRS
ncbi:MAG TPA: S9 family peptidase [Thermomicrobiales bacterium]|nr:S9 family peptidase [Thermomicrobiales bacterium]